MPSLKRNWRQIEKHLKGHLMESEEMSETILAELSLKNQEQSHQRRQIWYLPPNVICVASAAPKP